MIWRLCQRLFFNLSYAELTLISKLRSAEHNRHLAGRAGGQILKKLVNSFVLRIIEFGVIEAENTLMLPVGRQKINF